MYSVVFMKRKKFKFFVILILSTMFVTACSSKKELKDGVFEGYYKDESATVKVVITIKDKKIVDCVREERDNKNNKIKDENYGKDDADFNYKQAQKAVKNSEGYAKKLVEVQDIDKVDSVSVATISYKRFKSAVKDALNK